MERCPLDNQNIKLLKTAQKNSLHEMVKYAKVTCVLTAPQQNFGPDLDPNHFTLLIYVHEMIF